MRHLSPEGERHEASFSAVGDACMKSAFREQMEKMRARDAIFLKEELGKERFLYGTQNDVRLNNALATQGL